MEIFITPCLIISLQGFLILLILLFVSHDIIDDGTITASLPPDINKMVDLADGIVKSVLFPKI